MKKKSNFNGFKIFLIFIFVSFLLKLISGQININWFKSETKPIYNKDLPKKFEPKKFEKLK
mgnify:CR=1 FL=1|jgi:hypothetical protein